MEERSWGEPGSRGMREEGGMRRSGAVSIQAGTGAGWVCAGTHTRHFGKISYIQRTPYLGISHSASGLRDRRGRSH